MRPLCVLHIGSYRIEYCVDGDVWVVIDIKSNTEVAYKPTRQAAIRFCQSTEGQYGLSKE